jgi:hypothetical protein
MTYHVFQRLRAGFSFRRLIGGAGRDLPDQSKLYTDSEIALIRQQLRVGNALARRAAKQRGYSLHPKLAANRQG